MIKILVFCCTLIFVNLYELVLFKTYSPESNLVERQPNQFHWGKYILFHGSLTACPSQILMRSEPHGTRRLPKWFHCFIHPMPLHQGMDTWTWVTPLNDFVPTLSYKCKCTNYKLSSEKWANTSSTASSRRCPNPLHQLDPHLPCSLFSRPYFAMDHLWMDHEKMVDAPWTMVRLWFDDY